MSRTLFHNCAITTLDSALPHARALVAEGETIVAIGEFDQCRDVAGPAAQQIDLDGGYVYPGFTDSHIHLANTAREMTMVDLRAATSYEEALEEIARFARTCRPDQWILGGRWAHNLWSRVQWPHRAQLDAVTGGRPAALASLDGHSIWANTAALAYLQIHGDTQDPVGGRIVRDDNGQPTGILQESATEAARHLWSTDGGDLRACLPSAFDRALSSGLTSIHEMDGVDAIDAFTEMRAEDLLPLRVFKTVPLGHLETVIASGWHTGGGDHWLRQGPVKIFADGALGSRSAAMIKGYRDDPGNHGIVRTPPEEIDAIVRLAADHGISAAIHAIGDQANRTALSVFAKHRRDQPGHGLRHRIEHAQHVTGEDLAKFGQLGVIASMQPTHCTDDMRMVEAVVPPGTYSYPWRALLDSGATLAFGSDGPIGTLEPLLGIHAAVSRQDVHELPPNGFQPEQMITVADAVHAYTVGAARASGEELVKGRLRVGMLADFVVLSDDLYGCEVRKILQTRVHRTVVGGRSLWTS